MIGNSHSQLCKKNSCSVKLQDGPYDQSPRKIPVEDFIFSKFVSFLIKGNTQFVQKVTFEPSIDFKQNHY